MNRSRDGVLVIRHATAASHTAAGLRARGHRPVLLALRQIRDTGAAIPAKPYDAVALTSAAAPQVVASRLADEGRPPWLDIPALCVGDATAAAAAAAGWRKASSAGGDAAALATMLQQRFSAGASMLYLAGRDRAFDLSAALRPAGIEVTEIAVYAAEPVEVSCTDFNDAIAQAHTVLLHSAASARHFFAVAGRCSADLSGLTLIAISRTVADIVPGELRAATRVAKLPNEAEMLALL